MVVLTFFPILISYLPVDIIPKRAAINNRKQDSYDLSYFNVKRESPNGDTGVCEREKVM